MSDKVTLKLQLANDLQSVYLTEALQTLHPSIIQMAIERFAEIAVKRQFDQRININRVIEILQRRN